MLKQVNFAASQVDFTWHIPSSEVKFARKNLFEKQNAPRRISFVVALWRVRSKHFLDLLCPHVSPRDPMKCKWEQQKPEMSTDEWGWDELLVFSSFKKQRKVETRCFIGCWISAVHLPVISRERFLTPQRPSYFVPQYTHVQYYTSTFFGWPKRPPPSTWVFFPAAHPGQQARVRLT